MILKSGDALQMMHPDGGSFSSYQAVLWRAESAEPRAARLAEKLKALGVDPDQV